ncbi:MAG: T9SS type A sorting domain-containing protein, partial [Bacteroidales bacterium]|nr:T9SS type A sorting domain-containing protein [Bacteroidales bacterium]
MDNSIAIDSTITDNQGYYFFDVLQNGTYNLGSNTTKKWGGGNSSDALGIMLHFAGFNILQGLAVVAADVDASGSVATLDALYVAQRFVGLVSSFPAGDWYFETPQAVVDGTEPLYIDYNAICFGDVNASYAVPFVKMAPSVTLNTLGVKEIKANEEFELPIFVANDMELGAISLVLDYPENKVRLLDVLINTDDNKLLFSAKDGKLRLSWYSLDPMLLSANDAMIILKLKAKGSVENVSFSLDAASELNDRYSNTIYNATLYIPELIEVQGAPNNYFLGYNHPNPFNRLTQIVYGLPEPAHVSLNVFNLFGEQVDILVDQSQSEGTYTVNYDGSNLVPGVYLYKIEVQGATQDFMRTRMMVVTE